MTQNKKKETIVQTEYGDELTPSERLTLVTRWHFQCSSKLQRRTRLILSWTYCPFHLYLPLLCIPHENFTLKRDAYSSGAASREQDCCGNEGLRWCDAMIFSRTALRIVWHCFHTTLRQTLSFTVTFKVLALVASHYRLSPSNQTPVLTQWPA